MFDQWYGDKRSWIYAFMIGGALYGMFYLAEAGPDLNTGFWGSLAGTLMPSHPRGNAARASRFERPGIKWGGRHEAAAPSFFGVVVSASRG